MSPSGEQSPDNKSEDTAAANHPTAEDPPPQKDWSSEAMQLLHTSFPDGEITHVGGGWLKIVRPNEPTLYLPQPLVSMGSTSLLMIGCSPTKPPTVGLLENMDSPGSRVPVRLDYGGMIDEQVSEDWLEDATGLLLIATNNPKRVIYRIAHSKRYFSISGGGAWLAGFSTKDLDYADMAATCDLPVEDTNSSAHSPAGVALPDQREYGQPSNAKEAAELIDAAVRGATGAQVQLAIAYSRGHGVPQDDCLAAAWFRRAGDEGKKGLDYLQGKGVLAKCTGPFQPPSSSPSSAASSDHGDTAVR